MPVYRIVPADGVHQPFDIITADAAAVLSLIERRNFGDAEVHCEGRYVCSIRLDANGVWCIHTREATAHANPSPE